MEKLLIGVGGMSCQGCVKNVTGVLRALPGVSEVRVSLEAGQAEIVFEADKVDRQAFVTAIEEAGFDIV